MTKEHGKAAGSVINKAATGIVGLDAIMQGGLPCGRTTLIEGGPGCGKTVLALQTLVNGARSYNEPGIFVALEENSERIMVNASTFGWDLPDLGQDKVFFLDARPSPELIHSGQFDFGGLLAALDSKVRRIGAKRIVFDALDIMLEMFDHQQAARKEMYRLNEWLNDNELTAIITAKSSPNPGGEVSKTLEFLQFMVDCSIFLRHELVESTSQRSIRVGKYRGSSFEENAAPMAIGPQGVEVAYGNEQKVNRPQASTERLSSGVERLDTMLGGGYYRGAGILLTGAPGTAKTTLAGAFAVASCSRGEKTLFVTLDSPEEEVVRNLASVNIHLSPYLEAGTLRFKSARSTMASAEIHLMRIREIAREHGVRCLVVDPISALSKSGNRGMAGSVIERLIDWAKSEGITFLCTSLMEGNEPATEGTAVQVSTIADTWVHLNYLVNAGERNRALSIIKSRGTSHSNQVRELILSSQGLTLADVYTAGGEVLMGTLRWEKERALQLAETERQTDLQRRKQELAAETILLEGRISAMRQELETKLDDIDRLQADMQQAATEAIDNEEGRRRLRHADIMPVKPVKARL
jgi:circadian clock protein KaiC